MNYKEIMYFYLSFTRMVRSFCPFEPDVKVPLFLLTKLLIICFKDNAASQHEMSKMIEWRMSLP